MQQQTDTFTQEVWASNLEVEMAKIRDIVELFPFVAMVGNEKRASLGGGRID